LVKRLALQVSGSIALAAVIALPVQGPAELKAGLAIFVLIGGLWVTQALHMTVTALLVPLLAAVTSLMTPAQALASFAHPIIFLFLGGFALAAALHRHGLDRWLSLRVLGLARGRRPLAIALLFALTAAMSMWISNTATAAMMLPLALGLLQGDAGDGSAAAAGPAEKAYVLLGVAYSASIGGMGTLVGSPPNAIAAAQAGIDFAEWLVIGVPLVVVLMPLMAVTLHWVLRPVLAGEVVIGHEPPIEWTTGRRLTLMIFALTVAGWILGVPLARWLGIAADIDAVVALTAVVALVSTRVLEWRDLEHQVQWGVLLLFGGGLALSAVLATSGASAWLVAGVLDAVAGVPVWLVVLAVVAFVVMLTELVSNTAAAALLVPVLIALAPELGLETSTVAAMIAVSASCAFMLPVATPPNALVFGTGQVPAASMMRCGLALNAVCIVVITGATLVWSAGDGS
jgi:sodium-dependent dicarboxylate transporter 2/3/5